MAISKKDAKLVVSSVKSVLTDLQFRQVLANLMEEPIKNKSFRKSIKRLVKMLERPKGRMKRAA